MTIRERNRRFVELHRSGCFLLPNAWDVGSARMLAAVGFPALATTSAGIAFAYGRVDHDGDGERLDRASMLARVGDIVAGVSVPVSADLEDGYGVEPAAVARTVADTVALGAAGGNIEDFTGDRAQPLHDNGLAVDRIRAARAAVDAAGEPFVLVGRTDALLVGEPLEVAVTRANAYLAAGADCAFVPGAADAQTVARLVGELDGPLNVVMGLTGNALSVADLAALGVRRITVGGSLARVLYHHLREAARELFDRGTFDYADRQIPHAELNALLGAQRP